MSINVIQNQPKGVVIFTSSQSWAVPPGVYRIKILAIGGGGGGGGGYSSAYIGGAGSSGSAGYSECSVNPGMVLKIQVGAGGSGGIGGSSPTAGGNGGSSAVSDPNGVSMVSAPGGGGGSAATSSANGANAGVPNPAYNLLSAYVIGVFSIAGNAGSGQGGAYAPALPLGSVASTTGITTLQYYNVGTSGGGGGVNSNGNPGNAGEVIIWWGD